MSSRGADDSSRAASQDETETDSAPAPRPAVAGESAVPEAETLTASVRASSLRNAAPRDVAETVTGAVEPLRIPPAPAQGSDGDAQTVTGSVRALEAAELAGDSDEEAKSQRAPQRSLPPYSASGAVTAVPSSPSAVGSSLTMASPLLTLHRDEYERSRLYLKMNAAMATAVLVVTPFMSGQWVPKAVVTFGMILAIVSSLLLLWRLRHFENYTPGLLAAAGLINSVVAFCGVYYFGFFSPAPAVYVLGIYFFGFGGSMRVTRLLYAVVALQQGVTAMLMSAEVIPDLGLIRATDLSLQDQILTQALFQTLLLCAYMLARFSRRATLEQVGKLERAVRQVSLREALLREAREELDRAMRVGGPGLMTDLVVGSYQLGNLIGRGGMGEIYAAQHVETSEPAAVKLLRRDVLGSHEHVTRFLREAEVAAQLDMPHVVKLLEVGRTQGEVPYLAMELLEGLDLSQYLREHKRLSPERALELVQEVGAALDAAQAAGIVHRDIKPQNLFRAKQDDKHLWKVLDFGVSKLTQGSGTLTKDHIVGTPGYMAPEQAQGEDVDRRTDLYALGAVAYRTLTGRPPFSSGDIRNVLYEVVFRYPQQPSTLVKMPADLELVLAIAIAKSPDDRFNSGAELAEAFELAANDELPEALRERARAILRDTPWRAG